jgi:hypothetical protein
LKIENLEWKGNNVYGKAKLLDTPMGQIAKTLVKEGSMGISSRGLGTVAEDGYVNEDFNLITYDLVTDPSNKPSWVNGIYEGQEFSLPGVKETDMNEDKIKEAQAAYFKYLMETIDEISEAMSVPDKHQLKILKDTVKNPAKGMFMGGSSAKEAEEILRTKFKFTDAQIKKLKR